MTKRKRKTAARRETPKPATVAKPEFIKVRATADGYHEHRYLRTGDVFLIPALPLKPGTQDPILFSHRWMELVDPGTPEKITSSGEALRKLAREGGLSMTEATKSGLDPDIDNPLGSDLP